MYRYHISFVTSDKECYYHYTATKVTEHICLRGSYTAAIRKSSLYCSLKFVNLKVTELLIG